MSEVIEKHAAANAARLAGEAARIDAARPNRSGPARGVAFEVELREHGEMITLLGYPTYGRAIHAITSIEPYLRDVGNFYGALVEILGSSDVRGVDLLSSGGSASGPEAAVDRRLSYRAMLDRARAVLRIAEPMMPVMRGRKPKGDAVLGPKRTAKRKKGTVIATRHPIKAFTVVEAVCSGDRTLADVLVVHGWAKGGRNQQRLAEYMSNILFAMAGAMAEVQPLNDGGRELVTPVENITKRVLAGDHSWPDQTINGTGESAELIINPDGTMRERDRPRRRA